jgi:hypothetical protein
MNVQEAYEKTVHCYRLSMRMLKIATYVALNIGVLLTALVSKGALLLMTNSVAKVQEVRNDQKKDFDFKFISDSLSRTLGMDVINLSMCSISLYILRQSW